MRSKQGQHDGKAVGFSALPERGFDSSLRVADLTDYVAHMSDLLEELRTLAAADARMDLLGRILGLALDEAARVASTPPPKAR